jgi:putative membrane protein
MNQQWVLWPVSGIFIWIMFWAVFGLFTRRMYGRNRWGGTSEKTPFDILKERYAKGEINKQEFEEKKKDLM